tara:strand:+ start:149 stop:1102 length:954 start_codon:yes stop_codon:yes gene_type:complete
MAKAFASAADLEEKTVTFAELGSGVYAYTAEGDPNTGVVVGDDGVLVADTQATPVMAQDVIRRVREVTDKPFHHVLLTHYHAVRVLGASAYGAPNVIASRNTMEMVAERGQQDYDSEVGRFPRLFQSVESIPGLTWPTMGFDERLTLYMGRDRVVEIMHVGKGHTQGDTIAWLPKEKILFSGDLVEYGATPYCGDSHLTDWPQTLEKLKELGPEKLVPGRGDALMTKADCLDAIESTQAYVTALFQTVKGCVDKGMSLKETWDHTYPELEKKYHNWVIFEHCMPFNVSRAYDEAKGHVRPQIWTAERDKEMWAALND